MLKTRVKWVEGLQFVGTADSNRAVVMDGSAKGGGAESAVRPKELLLLSLAGCTGMDVVSIMKKMRLDVRSFEVRVEGEDAQNHPKAFKKIKLSYLVAGKELPEDKVRKAIELSQDKYCSVSATLKGTVEIDYTLEIRDEG